MKKGVSKKSTTLYRYISFENFTQIILFHRDRVTRPISWPDKTEGYLYQYLDNPAGQMKLLEGLYFDFSHENIEVCMDTFLKLAHSYMWCYCQCWTETEEMELMWRANSYGNRAIRIEADKEVILQILKTYFPAKGNTIFRNRIRYDVDRNKPMEQIKWLTESKIASEPFLHKLKEYSYENEFRFIVQQNKLFGVISLFEQVIANELRRNQECLGSKELFLLMCEKVQKAYETQQSIRNIPNSLDFTIPDTLVPKYISGVTVHPDAPDWYVKYIGEICEKYGIKFKGKSDLYEPAFSVTTST